MIEKAQIANVLARLRQVEADMGDATVIADAKRYRETVREHTALKKLEAAATRYFKLLDDIEGNRALAEDPDLGEMAKEELQTLEASVPEAERAVLAGLLPPDPLDARAAVFEVRAGTGGEEAALFAGDLFRMYVRYCEATRGVFTRDDAAIMLGVARQALWAHHNPALEGRKPSLA